MELNNEPLKSRLNWVDWAKAIGIFLVVLGHTPINDQAQIFIFSFHMPLFFVISGYLAKPGGVKKNITHLMIPYAYYYLIAYVFFLFTLILQSGTLNTNIDEIFIKPLIGMVIGNGKITSTSTFSHNVNVPLWFIMSLFIVKTIFDYIADFKSIYLVVLSIISASLVYIFSINHIILLFTINNALMAFPFFIAGFLLKKYSVLEGVQFSAKSNIALFILFFILFLPLCYINGRSDINALKFGANPLLYYFVGLIGTLMIFFLSKALNSIINKFIQTISQGTLLILGIHYCILLPVVVKFFWLLLIHDKYVFFPFPLCIIMSLLIIGLCYFPIKVSLKYFPILLGRPNYKK